METAMVETIKFNGVIVHADADGSFQIPGTVGEKICRFSGLDLNKVTQAELQHMRAVAEDRGEAVSS